MLTTNLIPLYMYVGYPIDRPEHLYDYVIAAQGIIKRLENSYVSADYLLAPIAEELIGLGLATYPLRPLSLKLPRIPGHLLQETLADARRNLNLEFMYHFRFDPGGRGWFVTRPEQERSGARVGYLNHDPAGIVLDLHSHHTMPAFFSSTDDRDERGGRFYAVIGRLDRPRPELILRLGAYGHWLDNIPALTLFDELGPFVDTYAGDYAGDHSAAAPFDDIEGVKQTAEGRFSFSNLFRRSIK